MCIRTGAAALALLWAGAASAQASPGPAEAPQQPETEKKKDEPTEEEMRALEKSLAADQADAAAKQPAPAPAPGPIASAIQSLNPDIALILDVTGAALNRPEPLTPYGHAPAVRGFNLQALELYLGAAVDPFFRLDANLVFGPEEVEVEEAYATSMALPLGLQLRAGQFLTRFGRANATHLHQWYFVDQPVVIGKFLGEDGSRGIGAEVSWLSPLPWYAELVASGTMPAGGCCARSFLPDGEAPDATRDLVGTLALKQFFPFGDDWSLLWGLSGQVGRNPVDRLTTIAGTDLYLRFRPVASPDREAVSLQAEALWRNRAQRPEALTDWGGYAQIVWNMALRWETGIRAEYVSGGAGDPLDPFWTTGRTRYAVQGTFRPSHFSRVRLQLAADDAGWESHPVYAAYLALEVAVGAHGAHTY